jgi:uncharacterized membrane protein YgcG
MSWLYTLVPHAYAVAINPVTPSGGIDPNSTANAAAILDSATSNIIDILFLIGGILAILYLLWAGIKYITAGGNMDQAKVARQSIINAVIGIIIMMAAFAIIRFAVSIGSTATKLDQAGTVPNQSTTGSAGNGTATNSSGTRSSTSSSTSSSTNSSGTTSGTSGTTGSDCPPDMVIGPDGECINP